MKYIFFPIFLGCPRLVIEESRITLQNGFLGPNKICKFATLNCIPKTIRPARDIFSRSVHFIVCKMFHFSYYLQYFNIKLLLQLHNLKYLSFFLFTLKKIRFQASTTSETLYNLISMSLEPHK